MPDRSPVGQCPQVATDQAARLDYKNADLSGNTYRFVPLPRQIRWGRAALLWAS